MLLYIYKQFQEDNKVIISHKEYVLNTTICQLTEVKTGITYKVSKNSLKDLVEGNTTYRKLMMEGLITK